MDYGFKNRAVRATNMNAESSRSHSIFTIYIDSQENDDKGNEKYKASKLNLVDLPHGIGIKHVMDEIKREFPHLKYGYFNPPHGDARGAFITKE